MRDEEGEVKDFLWSTQKSGSSSLLPVLEYSIISWRWCKHHHLWCVFWEDNYESWKLLEEIWWCRKTKLSFSYYSHNKFLTPDVWSSPALPPALHGKQAVLPWTPIGCPLIQFQHYLPGDSVRFHRLRTESLKTAPTSNASLKPQDVLPVLWLTGYKSRFPGPLLGFD